MIYIGGLVIEDNLPNYIQMVSDTWSIWENPTYHTRLKESYYVVKETFAQYNE